MNRGRNRSVFAHPGLWSYFKIYIDKLEFNCDVNLNEKGRPVMLLRNLFVSLVSMCLCATLVVAAPKKLDPKAQNKGLAEFLNGYETLHQAVDGMQFFGYLDASDNQEILAKMKQMGVDPETHMSKVTADGNKLRFGKTAVLVDDGSGKIKTGEGRILKVTKSMTMVDLFVQGVQAQTGKTYGGHSLFLNEAQADAVDVVDAVGSGLGWTAKQVNMGMGDIVSPVFSGGIVVLGGSIEGFNSMVRNWVEKGTVRCQDGKFITLGFAEGRPIPDIWNSKGTSSPEKLCDFIDKQDEFMGRIVTGHSQKICRAAVTAKIFLDNSVEKRDQYYFLTDSLVEKELGSPAPSCTKELASKLNDKWKSRFKKEIDDVKEGKPSKLLNPVPSGPGAR
jgi:hypothetical protein